MQNRLILWSSLIAGCLEAARCLVLARWLDNCEGTILRLAIFLNIIEIAIVLVNITNFLGIDEIEKLLR